MSDDRGPGSLAVYTPARVSLLKTGVSLATSEVLDFQLAHAQARDAVHAVLDTSTLLQGLGRRNLIPHVLQSAAPDRATYLRHPELGRILSPTSAAQLRTSCCDLAFVLVDGLSALAVDRHALPLLDSLFALLPSEHWSVGPVCIVQQGRVAIGDEIGGLLRAATSVVLIGERPGLSAPDSMGAYITWQPRPGRSDAERNCVSNIRPEGLTYEAAAHKLASYLYAAREQKQTGVNLKESAGKHGRLSSNK